MKSFISLLEIFNVKNRVKAFNAKKIILANVFGTFFIKGNPGFRNSPGSLPRNPPYWTILCY